MSMQGNGTDPRGARIAAAVEDELKIPGFLEGNGKGTQRPAMVVRASSLPARSSTAADFAPPSQRPPVPPEVESHDKHLRAAAEIEHDAEVLREHSVSLDKYLNDGLASVEQAMVAALKKAEARCAETRVQLVAANDAHKAAVAEYLTLCGRRADDFRNVGVEILGYIKKADDRLAAKRDAILRAGEDAEPAAAATHESGSQVARGAVESKPHDAANEPRAERPAGPGEEADAEPDADRI
jgi:hypothetical protein